MEREELALQVDGFRGRVEAILNLVPGAWDVRVNGRKSEDWETHDRYVVARFVADGPTQLSLKFDL